MSLHITALDINQNDLEDLSIQKCLLPPSAIPSGALVGQWARLTLQSLDDEDLSTDVVCQFYERSFAQSSICYVDKSVAFGNDFVASNRLTKVEILQRRSINSVNVSYVLHEKFLLKHSNRLNVQFFKNMTRTYLQAFTLISNCTVRTKFLDDMGIASVNVQAVSECDRNDCYAITDEVDIANIDVSLLPSARRVFHDCGYQSALDTLDEMLALLDYQRSTRHAYSNRINTNVLLVGPSGCGKSALLSHFLEKNKCNVLYIDPTDVPSEYPGDFEMHLNMIFKSAEEFERRIKPKAAVVIVIRSIHLLCPTEKASTAKTDQSARSCTHFLSLIDKLNARRRHIICIATTNEPESLNESVRRPGRFERTVTIPLPTMDERRHLIRAIFEESLLSKQRRLQLTPDVLDHMAAETQGFVYADLYLLIDKAQQIMMRSSEAQLDQVMRDVTRTAIPMGRCRVDVAVSKPKHGFEIIGGNAALKHKLRMAVLAGLSQHEAFQRFSLALPKGVLLYGPPGCAKTSIAKCLAYEAKMTFIAASAAEVYSPYVGHAERFITKIFDTARRNAPCLIFLDEIDALVGRRTTSDDSSSSDVQGRILSTLLMEMDGVSAMQSANPSGYILVVAATNRPAMVDDALMRPGRFDKLIHVPAPDEESRFAILQLCSKRMRFAESVDLKGIAQRTVNYSGADINNLCNEAALQALQRDINTEAISREDFEVVLKSSKPSLREDIIENHLNFGSKA